MEDFDFNPATPVLALDLARDAGGDVSSLFVECTSAVNRRLVESIFKIYADVGLVKNILPVQLRFLAAYPDSLKRVR